MLGYLTVLAIASSVTFVATGAFVHLAPRLGLMKEARSERDVHSAPTPVGGGVAMYLGLISALGAAFLLPQFRDTVFADLTETIGVVLGAAVMLVVGLADDRFELNAPSKLTGMWVAAACLFLFGVTMSYFRVPFLGVFVLSPDLLPLVTTAWLLLMANVINLADGLDGLAAGIVGIGAVAIFLYSDRLFKAGLLPDQNIGPLIAIITFGICLGFIPHNFHPARVFMGDAGALLLGLLTAVSTSVVGGRADFVFSGRSFFFWSPLLTPLLILGVPMLDTVFSFLRRVLSGKSFATGDREHVHHRLMRMGHGHRRTVVLLWAWTALLSAMALLPSYTGKGNAMIPVIFVALGILLYTLFHPEVLRQRRGSDFLE